MNLIPRRGATETDLAVAGFPWAHILEKAAASSGIAEDDGVGVVHGDGTSADRGGGSTRAAAEGSND